MRLISQDGMIDVPYEQVSLEVNEKEIYCGYSSSISRHCTGRLLGKYSNEEKSERVLEMVREKYSQLETLKIAYRDGMISDWEKEFGFNKVEEVFRPIFKFPKDEEV